MTTFSTMEHVVLISGNWPLCLPSIFMPTTCEAYCKDSRPRSTRRQSEYSMPLRMPPPLLAEIQQRKGARAIVMERQSANLSGVTECTSLDFLGSLIVSYGCKMLIYEHGKSKNI